MVSVSVFLLEEYAEAKDFILDGTKEVYHDGWLSLKVDVCLSQALSNLPDDEAFQELKLSPLAEHLKA